VLQTVNAGLFLQMVCKQINGGTFSASALHHFLGNNEFTLPKPANFEGNATEISFIIIHRSWR
jgi:hypothetical protein